MHYKELASRVRAKYPGTYDDLDDKTLAEKVVAKFPVYSDTTFGDEPGKMEALGRGAAQGLTLGHADEITGAIESLMTDKSYRQARDESRANYEEAEKAHPVISTVGEIAGSVPTYAAAGMAGAPGIIAAGAIQGEGKSDAPIVSADTAKNAAIGGATNAVLHGAGKYFGEQLKRLGPWAEKQAVRAVGAGTRDIENMGLPKTHELGRTILDKGLLKVAPEELPEEIMAMKQQIKPIYEKFLGSIPEEKWLKPQDLINDLENLKLRLTGGGKGGYDADKLALVDKAIGTIKGKVPPPATPKPAPAILDEYGKPMVRPPEPPAPEPGLSPQTVKGIKTDLQDAAKWQFGEDSLKGNTNRAVAGTVRRTFENSLGGAPGLPKYRAANKLWGQLETMEDMAMKGAAREFGAPIVTGTDAAFGALGMLTGSPMNALKSMGTRRAIRSVFSPRHVARSADMLAKHADLAPAIFGKYAPIVINAARRGPQALAVTHYTMQQRDPGYRAMFQGDENEAQ